MNSVVLLGNLTRDPELNSTNNGIEVANFTVAVQRRVANKDGEREADFINCTAWRKTAAFIAKYFKKGDKIAIQGSLQVRKYTDKNGEKRTAYEVMVDNAHFCSSRNSGGQVTQDQPAPDAEQTDEEIPF